MYLMPVRRALSDYLTRRCIVLCLSCKYPTQQPGPRCAFCKALLVGVKLLQGRFEVTDAIGGGGFSYVYEAWDHKRNCKWALREVRGDIDQAMAQYGKHNFMREFKALKLCRAHPNIVTLFGMFTEMIAGDPDPTDVLILERLDGRPVRDVMLGPAGIAPLPDSYAYKITLDLLSALGCVHANGLVHRDVSWGNVFVDKGGRIVLIDFGGTAPTSATLHTSIVTMGFVAPEADPHNNIDAEIGPATDLFGATKLLYFMLTGDNPAHQQGPLDPAQLRSRFDRPLANLLAKGTHNQPKKRFGSAAKMAEELSKIAAAPIAVGAGGVR